VALLFHACVKIDRFRPRGLCFLPQANRIQLVPRLFSDVASSGR
jgi:hypothetical protein